MYRVEWELSQDMLPALLFSDCVTDYFNSSVYTWIFIIFKMMITVASASEDSLRSKWVNLCQGHRSKGFKVNARF